MTQGERSEASRPSNSVKRAIVVLGAIGVLTFFLPIVHVAPGALGRADWSAFEVTTATLSSHPVPGVYDAFEYFGPYVVLALSILMMRASRWHKLVFSLLALNLWCVGKWDFDKITFFSLDPHWPAAGSFERLPAYWVLAIVMALMLYLTWMDYRSDRRES